MQSPSSGLSTPSSPSSEPVQTTEDLHPLWFNRDIQLFVCPSCKTGVNGIWTSIKAHLTQHSTPPEQVERIRTFFYSVQSPLRATDHEALQIIARNGQVIQGLPVTSGYACEGVLDCTITKLTSDEATRHNQKDHQGAGTITKVKVQKIFHTQCKGMNRYFRVQSSNSNRNSDAEEAETDDTNDLVALFHKQQREVIRIGNVWSTTIDSRELSMWDRRAGWAQMLDGVDLVQHHALTRLPNDRVDPSSWCQVLIPAVSTLVARSHQSAASKSPTVLRIFKSTDSNPTVITPDPMHLVLAETLPKYTVIWQRLFCFLLRAEALSTQASRVRWSSPVQQGVARLRDLLNDVAPSPTAVVQQVQTVSIELIVQRLDGDADLSPIMGFLAAWAFDDERKHWKMAHEVAPTLSQLIYIVRLVSLDHTLGANHDHPRTISDARSFVDQHLRDGTEGVFAELFSLRLYARARAADFYVRPSVTWNTDASVLYHEGTAIEIDVLRSWMVNLITDAQRTLCEDLLVRSPAWLKRRRDPSRFEDLMTWSTATQNFRHHHRNHVEDAWGGTLSRIRDSSPIPGLWQAINSLLHGGPRRPDALSSYIRQVEGFLERLLVILTMAGGLPPRGTEITSWKHSNGRSTMRNFYIVGGRLASVADYNKTDAVSGSPKVVIRFYPPEVAQLYIAYVVDVLPLVQLIQARAPLVDDIQDAYSPFLFHIRGRHWDTDKLTRLMAKYSAVTLDGPLGVAKWRDMAIAIDKKLIRPVQAGQDDHNTHALQAGHSIEVEAHHYALTVGMLHSVSDETLTAFGRVSRRWEEWWAQRGPRVASTPVPTETVPLLKLLLTKLEGLSGHVHTLTSRLASLESTLLSSTTTVPPSFQLASISSDHGFKRAPTDDSTSTEPDSKRSRLDSSPVSPSVHGEVDALIKELMGPTAVAKSRGQRKAIEEVVIRQSPSTVVRLRPAGGKTLVIQATAARARGKVTVVIVPYVVLREDLIRRCASLSQPISTSVWTVAAPYATPLVFVTPETVGGSTFRSWLVDLDVQGVLEAVFVDECHTLVLDEHWRQSMKVVISTLARLKARIVLLSGTLPRPVMLKIQTSFQVASHPPTRPRFWSEIIDEAIDPQHLTTKVEILEWSEHSRYLQQLVGRAQPQARLLIVVMTVKDGERLAQELHVPFYHRTLSDSQKAGIWQRWRTGDTYCLIGTSAVSVGTDVSAVQTVVHHRGAYGLIAYYQHATRAGRDGQGATSISLLTPNDRQRLAGRFSSFGNHNRVPHYYLERWTEGTVDSLRRQPTESVEEWDVRMLWHYLSGQLCRYRLLYWYLNDVVTHHSCPWKDCCPVSPIERSGRPVQTVAPPVTRSDSTLVHLDQNTTDSSSTLGHQPTGPRPDSVTMTTSGDTDRLSTIYGAGQDIETLFQDWLHDDPFKDHNNNKLNIESISSPLDAVPSPNIEPSPHQLPFTPAPRTTLPTLTQAFNGTMADSSLVIRSGASQPEILPTTTLPRTPARRGFLPPFQTAAAAFLNNPPLELSDDSIHWTGSDDQHAESETILVAGIHFGRECCGRTRQAVQATLRVLRAQTDDHAMCVKALELVSELQHGNCVGCWLDNKELWTGHTLDQCPEMSHFWQDIKGINSGWAMNDKDKVKNIHWACGLPTIGPLSHRYVIKQPCSRYGTICRDLVAVAIQLSWMDEVFQENEFNHPWQHWESAPRIAQWTTAGKRGVSGLSRSGWTLWNTWFVRVVFVGYLARMEAERR